MTTNGTLSITARVQQSETVGGIPYSGTPSIEVSKSVKAPTYTKSWHDAATIAVATTLNIFGAVATPSGTITYGSPSNGSTVVVTGPEDGPYTFTKVASSPAANQFSAIGELTTLINDIDGLGATDDGSAITITVSAAGADQNSWTITGTSSYSGLSITFSAGADSDLTDPFGNPVNIAALKGLVIKNTSGSATLTVGGGSNPLFSALPAITAGGSIALDLSITASASVKNLRLDPSASLAYELILFGT